MATADGNSVHFKKDSKAEVEEVEIIEERTKKRKKTLVFVLVDGLSKSTENRRMNERIVKPPKNLHLVEGDPDDTVEFRKTRGTRSFPSEHFLSTKIRQANGTDYSNHFIEQHYNRRLNRIQKCKKKCKSVKTDAPELLRKKKIPLDDLGLGTKKGENFPAKNDTQDVIIVDDSPDSSKDDETVTEDKNVEDYCGQKLHSKSNKVAENPRLVLYSDSEEEIDGMEVSSDDDEESGTAKSRQCLILEGLKDDTFKFRTKSSDLTKVKNCATFVQLD